MSYQLPVSAKSKLVLTGLSTPLKVVIAEDATIVRFESECPSITLSIASASQNTTISDVSDDEHLVSNLHLKKSEAQQGDLGVPGQLMRFHNTADSIQFNRDANGHYFEVNRCLYDSSTIPVPEPTTDDDAAPDESNEGGEPIGGDGELLPVVPPGVKNE